MEKDLLFKKEIKKDCCPLCGQKYTDDSDEYSVHDLWLDLSSKLIQKTSKTDDPEQFRKNTETLIKLLDRLL